LPRSQLRQTLEALVSQMLTTDRVILTQSERQHVVTWILDETVGYGPLEPFLQDPSITEIMVVQPQEIYVERAGRIERVDARFRDVQHIRHVVERIIAPLGRHLDESTPMVDARLPDGSRVNAIAQPLCVGGIAVTIRRFAAKPLGLADLTSRGSMIPEMAAFLAAVAKAKMNVLVAGGTGSGKTTLLGAVAACIPHGERLVIIEDMSEIRLDREHVISLEGRPPNNEGKGEVTIRHLLKNALRMRPDRIIVGEVRGDEAMDMLQAMNTGHEGSLTTIHANSPEDAFGRLEAMITMSGVRLPVEIIRRHLVAALDLVVQTHRYEDGTRRVAAIAEVSGTHTEGSLRLNPVFEFERTGVGPDGQVEGRFVVSDRAPACLDRLRRFGTLGDLGTLLAHWGVIV
jgi:pilus assembly protein CpaF